jgi:hypothetical protein
MKKAALYARVSTDAQQKEATIESQLFELARIAGHIKGLDTERRRIIGLYARGEMPGEEYIAANRALDKDLDRLTRRKAELAAALRSPQHEDLLDASIRQFCATANSRFHACADFDAERQFLVDHVDRVIYNGYKVTITGSVPVQTPSGQTKLQFRIAGEIDKAAVRRNAQRKIAETRMATRSGVVCAGMSAPS